MATNALELGIDIGDLDAAICVTFPGTVAQPAPEVGPGRARARPAWRMYVAGDDALDQFFCRHPDEFLERPVEAAILDHASEEIHIAHLAAAAYERPLSPRTPTSSARAGGVRRAAGRGGRAARARRPLAAARVGLPGGATIVAALRLARQLHDRRGDRAAS